jgi:DNA-binding NtrC family response regulator
MKRILFLEDDIDALGMGTEILSSVGRVYPARFTDDARRILQMHDKPDVLVSDFWLGGETSLAFIAEFQERYPGIPIILLSSHADAPAILFAGRKTRFMTLSKPCSAVEMCQAVERALEGDSPRRLSLIS